MRKSAQNITRSKTASDRKAGSDEDDRRHIMMYAIYILVWVDDLRRTACYHLPAISNTVRRRSNGYGKRTGVAGELLELIVHQSSLS